MPVALKDITVETFRPLEKQTFAFVLPSGQKTEGSLDEIIEREPYGQGRIPFKLRFLVPHDESHPTQGTLSLEHASLGGAIEVFAVPTGRNGAIVTWEVIFN